MKVNVVDLDQMTGKGCSTPGCTEDHTTLFLRSRCHSEHRGVNVAYTNGSGFINVSCAVCDAPIVDVKISNEPV